MAVAAKPRSQLSTRRRLAIAVVVVLAALGFLLWRGLGDATVYFKTADQAVAEKAELGDRRFRIEGEVVDGSVAQRGDRVSFVIEENDVKVDVLHQGDPPELFQEKIPVVLEGRFRDDTFHSDRIMVRHSNEYQEKNPERVKGSPVSS